MSLKLCISNTLWTFRHEITPDKMQITGSERDSCLAVLKDMAYSSDDAMYNRHMDRLEAVGCSCVLEYVRSSWHDIRSQWVEGLKEQHFTLGETTVHRLESVRAKMKNVCCEIASLQQFFTEFRSFLTSMRTERTHSAMMMLTRKPTAVLAEDLLPYRDSLTPYAFRLVQQQYKDSISLGISSEVDENVDTFLFASNAGTDTTRLGCCSCQTYTSLRLPCKHLLYVRRLRDVEFDESVFDSRWKRADYLSHCQLNLSDGANADFDILDINCEGEDSADGTLSQRVARRSVEQAEKYRKAHHMATQLASLCAKSSMALFSPRLTLLQRLYDSWSRGAEVSLVKLETAAVDTPSSSTRRGRGRPAKNLSKAPAKQLRGQHPRPVGRPKGSTKTVQRTQKLHQSAVVDDNSDDDDSASAVLNDDDDDRGQLTSEDEDSTSLAMGADDDDEMADNSVDQSSSVDGTEDLAAAGDDRIIDISEYIPEADASYVIVPENSALLAEVEQDDGIELQPLDALNIFQTSSAVSARKRGRPKGSLKTTPKKSRRQKPKSEATATK